MASIRIRQIKSSIGRPKDQGATLRALGVKRIGHEVVKEDSPAIRGMVHKVSHLIEVEEIK